MKKFISMCLVLSMVLCLAACGCEHEWADPSCTEAQVCSLCGEAGELPATGHTAGEFELASEDLENFTAVYEQKCRDCGEVLDSKTENIPAYKDGKFLLTVEEMVEGLCAQLPENVEFSKYEEFENEGTFSQVAWFTENGELAAYVMFMSDDGYLELDSPDIEGLGLLVGSGWEYLNFPVMIRNIIRVINPHMDDVAVNELFVRCVEENDFIDKGLEYIYDFENFIIVFAE